MSPRLPIYSRWAVYDWRGNEYTVEIQISQTNDKEFYPPNGERSVFRLEREKSSKNEECETMILIDNHYPFGFHEHAGLPREHNKRIPLHVSTWQGAWYEFDLRVRRILYEA